MMDISQFLQDPAIRQSILSMMQQRGQQMGQMGAQQPAMQPAAPTMGLADIMKNGAGMLGMLGNGGNGLMSMLSGALPAVPRNVTQIQPM